MASNHHTIIIAEIGENHLGNMDMAKVMIEQAADAGADIVKFQSYRGVDVSETDPEREWFGEVELSEEDHRDLMAYAEQHGIDFMSSPFSIERARLLCEGLGLKRIKIASSEMTNHRLLDYVNAHADTVFLSTGLATLDEVRESVSHLADVKDVYVLHCVTQYPCDDGDANLLAIRALQTGFPDHKIGYSDHTIGLAAPLAAVGMGAQVIEKHYTLAKSLPGTDHILSVDPGEFREMVAEIRRLETMLGSGEKTPRASEMEIRDMVRGRWAKD